MNAESRGPTIGYERLSIHRMLLVWTHVAFGLIVALIYLKQIDYSHVAYWRRYFGLRVTFTLVPPLLPYLVSTIYSRSVVTPDRMRLCGFLLVVILGFVLEVLLLLGAFGSLDRVTLFVLFGIQTFVYVLAAKALWHLEGD